MTTRFSFHPRLAWLSFGLAIVLITLSSACGGDDAADRPAGTADTTAAGADLRGSITVFAAASLTDAFKEEGTAFEKAHPGVTVKFNFGGSSALATQINEGAPADLFASADGAQLKVVADRGAAEAAATFATNVPVVVVPADGGAVKSFEDLAKPGVKLVLAAPAVPVGNYSRQILTLASAAGSISPDFSAKVLANLKSNETDVRAVLAKVQTGEADAGIVYTTDAAAVAKQVKTIPVPLKYNVVAEYPIAVIKASAHVEVARAFQAFILSEAGQLILAKWGFGKPAAR